MQLEDNMEATQLSNYLHQANSDNTIHWSHIKIDQAKAQE